MAELRASTSANRKLRRIILLLLLPVVVLGYMLFSAWNDGIRFAGRELDGLETARYVFPVLIANARNVTEHSIAREDLAEIFSLQPDHKADPAIVRELKKISDSNISAVAKVEAMQDLFGNIGADSGLLLDPKAEPLFLILMLFHELPAIAQDYHEQQVFLANAVADNEISPKELADLTLVTGNLLELMEGLEEAMGRAEEASTDRAVYADLRSGVKIIYGRINAIKMLLHDSTSLGPEDAFLLFYHTNQLNDNFLDTVQRTWSDGAGKVQKLIEARKRQLIESSVSLGAFGALSCLLSLGFAFSMFQTNLKRLDEVAVAHDSAEIARGNAERLAREVSQANEATERLNHELSESLKALKLAQDSIIKKGRMEQLGALTATVAHELRNPLSTVWNTAFILDKKLSEKAPDLKPQLQRISNSIHRCDAIISQLLDYSHSREISASMNDMDQWLMQLIEEQALILPHAVRFECSLGLGQSRVWFDPDQLRRAVINLVANASEALVGKGDDPTKFTVIDPVISVSTAQRKAYVELGISDNGPGIQPVLIEKIRDPLFTTKSFGTGLGIPIVEQIVTRHGGKLEISSTLGKGTTFTIHIPMKQANAQAA